MICRYQFESRSLCPADNSPDVYQVEVTSSEMIRCETLIALADLWSGVPIFQEELTKKLAAELRCPVVTTGTHCNGLVTVRVEC